MAFHAYSGWPAVIAFVVLSILTWWFTYRGWVCMREWNVTQHGQWMRRSFILVCSAVVLRAMVAQARQWDLHSDTAYALISWLCWLPTWLAYEVALLVPKLRWERTGRRSAFRPARPLTHTRFDNPKQTQLAQRVGRRAFRTLVPRLRLGTHRPKAPPSDLRDH